MKWHFSIDSFIIRLQIGYKTHPQPNFGNPNPIQIEWKSPSLLKQLMSHKSLEFLLRNELSSIAIVINGSWMMSPCMSDIRDFLLAESSTYRWISMYQVAVLYVLLRMTGRLNLSQQYKIVLVTISVIIGSYANCVPSLGVVAGLINCDFWVHFWRLWLFKRLEEHR